LLGALEETRLLFDDKGAFTQEYARYERVSQKLRARLTRVPPKRHHLYRMFYHRAQTYLAAFGSVDAEIKALGQGGPLRIKSRFFRAKNRRFHAAHFWPEHVSARLDKVERARWVLRGITGTSQRARWFKFEDRGWAGPSVGLSGYDISSSQTQILAILLGIDELEQLGPDAAQPFKFTSPEKYGGW
jgi:hypothetical protein